MDPKTRQRRARLPGLGAAAVAAIAAVALGVLSPAADARGEEQPRAGLVVQFADGSVNEYCIDLGGSEITGLELLGLSGLGVRYESVAGGAQVCRIGGHGCADDQPCWCQCQVIGPDCVYWAYHTLEDGAWSYSRIGASSRTVRHGDVDGWAWGSGNVTSGAQPPVRQFEDLCGRPEATPDQKAAASPSLPPPGATSHDVTPEATAPVEATMPPAPGREDVTPDAGSPTGETPVTKDANAPVSRTPAPTRTARPENTVPLPRATNTSIPGSGPAGRVHGATGTDTASGGPSGQPSESELDGMLRATSDARLATIAALAYAPGALDGSSTAAGAGSTGLGAAKRVGAGVVGAGVVGAGSDASADASPTDASHAAQSPRASWSESGESARQGGLELGQAAADGSESGVGDDLARDAVLAGQQGAGALGYLVYAGLVVVLGGAWLWLRMRRRSTTAR